MIEARIMEITKEVKDANWNSAGKLRGQLPRNLERRGIDHRTNPARVLIRRWLRVTGREDVPGQLKYGQLLHVFANGNPKIAPQSDLTLSTALAGTPVIAAMLSGLVLIVPHFASLWFFYFFFENLNRRDAILTFVDVDSSRQLKPDFDAQFSKDRVTAHSVEGPARGL